jgi:imidazole glycerol-phosphate synthase subunit HisH
MLAMIGVIDVKSGNIGSLIKVLDHLELENEIVTEPNSLEKYDKLILPGIGAFDYFIKNLRASGFLSYLSDKENFSNQTLIGICLGMQVLGNSSEEGSEKGLSLISGKNIKFDNKITKVPNIGWHYAKLIKNQDKLNYFNKEDQRFYFCHSYHFVTEDNNVLAKSFNGQEYNSIIKHPKYEIFGFQFHPEKSHNFGIKLLGDILNGA